MSIDNNIFYYHSDHLGSAAYLTKGGQVTQTINYLPYGEDCVEQNYINPQDTTRLGIYRFNRKEKGYESGFHYYSARYYWSELMTMWLSVDPMADKYPNISPYAYCAWNPIKQVDPSGCEISTHTDNDGNVVAVYNDGDNGVYRHNGDRNYTLKELRNNYSVSNTSAGGVKMGETKYWDEFMNHDSKTGHPTEPGGKIYYGESWEQTIVSYNELSISLGLEATAFGSLTQGVFDIKTHTSIAPEGALTGKLLEGYYTSAESAGNFLAGLNGATAKGLFGQHISWNTYITLAGALHSRSNKTSRDGVYKGKIGYAGRRIREGFLLGAKIRSSQ